MTFKVISQLTNIRSPKDDSPLLTATPSKGIIKLTASAISAMGVAVGDHLTIVEAETDNGKNFFVTKVPNAPEGEDQNGSKLSPSTAGVNGGTLQFSSENAWRQLGGNKDKRKIYSFETTPVEDEGKKYFLLSYLREEDKQVREAKEETTSNTETESAE